MSDSINMKKHSIIYLIIFVFFSSYLIFSAAPPVFPEKRPGVDLGKRSSDKPLPKNYKKYTFGMTRQEILDLVKKDPDLKSYDADFIEGFEKENWNVLITAGRLKRVNVIFSFYENKLYNIMLSFNQEKYSYYGVLKEISKKFGWPNIMGQNTSIWQDKSVRIQLERGPYLKYFDIALFKKIKKSFSTNVLPKSPDKYSIFRHM